MVVAVTVQKGDGFKDATTTMKRESSLPVYMVS